jgi:Na+/proline symporter
MGFLQNYFGLPFALIVVCAIFIPIYHRLKVVTAYEYLGQRFDQKTRSLGAFLFLLQRGLAAGITLYAPAIILSTLLGWNLRLTILLAGLFVVLYTTSGGTTAVSHTQKWQMAVILAGMGVAFGMILHRLPADCSFLQAVSVAGKMGKLNAVDFSFDFHRRYTFWSGLLGASFSRSPISGPTSRRCSGTSPAGLSPVAASGCSSMPCSSCRCSFSFSSPG